MSLTSLTRRIARLESGIPDLRDPESARLFAALEAEARVMDELRAATRELYALIWEAVGYPDRAHAMRAAATPRDIKHNIDIFEAALATDEKMKVIRDDFVATARAVSGERAAAPEPCGLLKASWPVARVEGEAATKTTLGAAGTGPRTGLGAEEGDVDDDGETG